MIKITERRAAHGAPDDDYVSEQRTYLDHDRKRVEHSRSFLGHSMPDGSVQRTFGPRVVTIFRCDLGKAFELDLDAGEFAILPHPVSPLNTRPLTEATAVARRARLESPRLGPPNLRIEISTIDTQERKELFGRPARHILTTRKETSLEGEPSGSQEMVVDGWYFIDFDPRENYDRTLWSRRPVIAHAFLTVGGRIVRPEFIEIGAPETGFAVQEVRTTKRVEVLPEVSKHRMMSRVEAIATLGLDFDSALFEVPSGFRQAAHINRSPH